MTALWIAGPLLKLWLFRNFYSFGNTKKSAGLTLGLCCGCGKVATFILARQAVIMKAVCWNIVIVQRPMTGNVQSFLFGGSVNVLKHFFWRMGHWLFSWEIQISCGLHYACPKRQWTWSLIFSLSWSAECSHCATLKFSAWFQDHTRTNWSK